MNIPSLIIDHLVAAVPIIQGGMGIGVSGASLAAAVANEKAIGIISGAQIGYREPDFETNTLAANLRALRKEIRKARELSPRGILGLNLMVAMNHYEELVKVALEEKIDLIVSGAGLPMDLPALIKGSLTKIGPIVSSGKGARVLSKLWDQRHRYIPDFVVVEGPEAGGHLGFTLEQLESEKKPCLMELVQDVKEALKPYEEKYSRPIPVIAAGGIFTGEEIAKHLKNGAAGVQMSTRFVATEECDASLEFKKAYLNSTQADIHLVKSPVGMPGRAIHNEFLEALETKNLPVTSCYDCLKPCNPANTPYCISKALIEAVKGNLKDGLIFSGTNAYRLEKITTVKALIGELMKEVSLYDDERKEDP